MATGMLNANSNIGRGSASVKPPKSLKHKKDSVQTTVESYAAQLPL